MLCTNWGKHQTHSLQAWKTRFWQTWNAKGPEKVRFPYFLYLLFQEQNFINANSIQYLTGKSKEYDRIVVVFLLFLFYLLSVFSCWVNGYHKQQDWATFSHKVKLCSILQYFQLTNSKSSKIFHLFKENFKKCWKKPFKSSLFHVFFTVLINNSWRC